MRNVVDYPLRPDEILEALERAIDQIGQSEPSIGDMTGYALFYLLKWLEINQNVLEHIAQDIHHATTQNL